MKRRAQEIYGFGPRLATRHDRVARLAQMLLEMIAAGLMLALIVSGFLIGDALWT